MMTLKYLTTEKSFADWGFEEESAGLTIVSQGTDVFTVSVAGARVEDDPIIPFEGLVTIYRGRTAVGVGGAIEFQGKRLLHVLDGRPEFEGVSYQFGGPWYDLDQTPYQQNTIVFGGLDGSGDPIFLTEPLSGLVLFQKVTAPGTVVERTNGEQITDVLQHLLDEYAAQSMAAPYQIGTIEPAIQLNTYQAGDMKCSEVIQLCLRSSPSAVVGFDYTTSPPTVHCKRRASLVGVSVALADGVMHESISLTPRYDLQPRSVVVKFKQLNSTPSGTWLQVTTQKEPADGPDGGLRVVMMTVDLAGFTESVVSGALECDPVANTRAWWQVYMPELASLKVRGVVLSAMGVTDESGGALSLATYPNVLKDGSSVKPWMKLVGGTPVVAVKATIKVLASWSQYDVDASGDPQTSTNGRLVGKFIQKELHARVTLTNGVTGPYSTTASFEDAEPVPAGLATALYNEMAVLQYEGEVSIVEQEVATLIGVLNVLNVTGGRAEWATMGAQIQQVYRQYGKGRTRVTVGPAAHLSAGDLTEIFMVNRLRRVWNNPAAQGSGSGGAASLDFGGHAPKENTNTGLDVSSVQKATADAGGGNTAEVVKDAENKRIVLQVTDATGAVVAGQPKVTMDLATLGTRAATWKWLYFKDAKDGCAAKKMLVMGTDPEADT